MTKRKSSMREYSLRAAATHFGIGYAIARHRVVNLGWDPYLAVTTPTRKWTKKP